MGNQESRETLLQQVNRRRPTLSAPVTHSPTATPSSFTSSTYLPSTSRSNDVSPSNTTSAPQPSRRFTLPRKRSPAPKIYETYHAIPTPTVQNLHNVAYALHRILSAAHYIYAIIGGLATLLYNGNRPTYSLDVLIEPRLFMDNGFLLKDLFARNPAYLNYSREGHHLVVVHNNTGVVVRFVRAGKCGFPRLIPRHTTSAPWEKDKRPPTWQWALIYPDKRPDGTRVPLLLPQYLLEQKLLAFERERMYEKRNRDVYDVNVFVYAVRARWEGFSRERFGGIMGRAEEFGVSSGVLRSEDVRAWRELVSGKQLPRRGKETNWEGGTGWAFD